MRKHHELKAWQEAMELVKEIYRLTREFPKEEIYGLTSQIRRAVCSISLNIAEGSGNGTDKEFRRYLEIALRSDYEVVTCLEIAFKLNYCSEEDFQRLTLEADEIAAMITGFSKSL